MTEMDRKVATKLVLAPLAGFTDAPFRRICAEHGADLTCTEMVSAAALAHGHARTLELMKTTPGEGPVGCQVFGATESDLAHAARVVDATGTRFCELNLNAGCPMTKVTRCGAGAKLAEDPEKVYRLLVAMKENTSLPVTLKTRLGPHPGSTTAFELLDAAARAGAAGVTFHARYTSQLHGGPLGLDLLAEIVSRAKIPVAGNGSVTDAASLARMAATGVAAVMVGRAALSNPGIFNELKGGAPLPRTSFLAPHLAALAAFTSDEAYIRLKLRTHLVRYFAGIPGAAAIRARVNNIKTIREFEELCCSHL